MKIAIIGAGNMGGAIARALARNVEEGMQIVVANPSQDKLDRLAADCPSIITTTSNVEAASSADYIVLAVKPWILPQVITEIRPEVDKHLPALVSVAGGVSIEDIRDMLGISHIINQPIPAVFHVITDTAISVGRGMTFISASAEASPEQLSVVRGIFEKMGQVAVIEERLMGAATALSSCGIAYVYKYIQASVQAGVQMGFYPRQALDYTLATIEGAVAMMQADPSTTPQQEIDRVTTPGGMTIKGINALEHSGFTSAIINAILTPLSK